MGHSHPTPALSPLRGEGEPLRKPRAPLTHQAAATRPPSPLNGETAGVRGANGPLRPESKLKSWWHWTFLSAASCELCGAAISAATCTEHTAADTNLDRNVRAPLNADALSSLA